LSRKKIAIAKLHHKYDTERTVTIGGKDFIYSHLPRRVPIPEDEQLVKIKAFINKVDPMISHVGSFIKDNTLHRDPKTGLFPRYSVKCGSAEDRNRKEHGKTSYFLKMLDANGDRTADAWIYVNILHQHDFIPLPPGQDGKPRFKPIYDLTGTIPLNKKADIRHAEAAERLGLVYLQTSYHNYIVESKVVRFVIDIDYPDNGTIPITYARMLKRCAERNVHPWMITETHAGGFHIVFQGDHSFLKLNYRLAMACMLTGEDPSQFDNVDLKDENLTNKQAEPMLRHLKEWHNIDPQYLKQDPLTQIARIPGTWNYGKQFMCDGDLMETDWTWEQAELDAFIIDAYQDLFTSPYVKPIKAVEKVSVLADVPTYHPSSPFYNPSIPFPDAYVVGNIWKPAPKDAIEASVIEIPMLDEKKLRHLRNQELLEKALNVPELGIIKTFLKQFVEMFANGIGWLMEKSPTFGIAQIRTAERLGCCQKFVSNMLRKLVSCGYLKRDDYYTARTKSYNYCFGEKLRSIGLDTKNFNNKKKLTDILKEKYEIGCSNEGMLRDVRCNYFLGKRPEEIETFIIDKYDKYVRLEKPKHKRSKTSLVGIVRNWLGKKAA